MEGVMRSKFTRFTMFHVSSFDRSVGCVGSVSSVML